MKVFLKNFQERVKVMVIFIQELADGAGYAIQR